MARDPVTLHWPNGRTTTALPGSDCLGGSCGACEIEVNGRTVRACLATVPPSRSGELTVELASDPYW
jgi:aerobic-type carbon monoxide dehydrogenase small subunit (CoxS/CutS family)